MVLLARGLEVPKKCALHAQYIMKGNMLRRGNN